MTDRDRLIKLLENSPTLDVMYGELEEWQQAADHLIANGVTVTDNNADAPTVDVVEVVHGEWCKQSNKKTCSVCAFVYYSNNDEVNYCPNCGAQTDGKENE